MAWILPGSALNQHYFRTSYRRVAAAFEAALSAVTPGQWEAQSPCEQWKVRDLVAHVIAGHRQLIARVRGGEAAPPSADEDPVRAWEEASLAVDEIAGDVDASAKAIDGPAGSMPAGQVISVFVTRDLLVHTWDLARAIGAGERLDEGSVREVCEAIKPMDGTIRQPCLFGAEAETTGGRGPADRVPALPGPPGVARLGGGPETGGSRDDACSTATPARARRPSLPALPPFPTSTARPRLDLESRHPASRTGGETYIRGTTGKEEPC